VNPDPPLDAIVDPDSDEAEWVDGDVGQARRPQRFEHRRPGVVDQERHLGIAEGERRVGQRLD
jgi:hypothetical protein